ncbi:MAG: translation elongation factor Ts [Actinobacteria bacterium]|nr:MAG: translation elongation factor Ts [Actinomycetota bacterium]
MPEFTAKDVQALRRATGAGMLDAKRALEESEGDVERARRWLREHGLASSGRRSDRPSSQGAVSVMVDGPGAIVELRCETDFVAKSAEFVRLVEELTQAVAAKGEQAAAERQADVDELKVTLKENISVGRVVHFVPADGAILDSYLHIQNGRGVNAVLVELERGTKELAHEVAVHIAFARPTYLARDDVPASEVEAERATIESISRKEGKPDAALPKIVEGRLTGWFKERCLLEQAYVRDEKRTIAQLLGEAKVTRFAQVEVGA